MTLRIKITPPNIGQLWAQQYTELAAKLNRALTAAMNIAASMILDAARQDISSAGNFGQSWTSGLTMDIEGAAPNMRMYLTHTIPYAGIFETGGVIQGKPFLWIPISGTDAQGVRASAFGGGLFSAKYPRKGGGPPLLFSMADKKPRYFGASSVTIPKKFQLTEDITNVMSNFRAVFDSAWQQA